MTIRSGIILLAILVPTVLLEEVRYDNYHLYEVYPKTKEHQEVLQEMESHSDSLIFLDKFRKSSTIVVAPHKISDFKVLLKQNGMPFRLDTKNVQDIIDSERKMFFQGKSEAFDWQRYNTLSEIYDWQRQQEKLHPGVATVEVIGQSYEKRELLALKISHKPGNKAIFVEGGMHSREWISPAVTTYLINELLNSNSTEMRTLAQKYDWYFVIISNPDGYVYTHEKNRFWRKTRKPYRYCVGADPNRNFDINWGSRGASKNPCSDIYAGGHAYSESEVLAVSNYVSRVPDLRLYMSLHSYSQLILLPYAYQSEVPENNEDLLEIANRTAEAIAVRYGTEYVYGNTHDLLYAASGSSMDWVRAKTQTELSFCFELRPKANWKRSFDLPSEEIIPTGEETVDGIKEMIRSSVELGYFD